MMEHKLIQTIATSFGGRMDGLAILVTCYRNLIEMMQDRGLQMIETCQTTQDLLNQIQRTSAVIRATTGDDDEPRSTYIYIDTDERTGVKYLRQLKDKHPDDNLLIVWASAANVKLTLCSTLPRPICAYTTFTFISLNSSNSVV